MLVRKNQGEKNANIQNSKSCKSSTCSCNILNEKSSKPNLDFVLEKNGFQFSKNVQLSLKPTYENGSISHAINGGCA
jgi:hypothetical protein